MRWHFAGGVVAGIVYAIASGLGLPLMAKIVFPQIFQDPGQEKKELSGYEQWLESWLGQLSADQLVLISCLWIPFIFLLRAAGGYFNTYLLTYCGYRVVEGIRDRVFSRLQSLPVGFFQKYQSGDLLARLTGDCEMLRQTVTKVSADLIKQPAQLVAAFGMLIYIAISDKGSFVAIISLLSIPLCILPIQTVGRKLAHRARRLQAVAGNLSGLVTESLQAPTEIRAFNLQEQVKKPFRQQIDELIRHSMKVVKYRQLISPAVELIAAIGLSTALYLGYRNGMTLSDFMALGLALYMSYEPIKKLGAIHTLLKQGEASLDRIEDVLHADGELFEKKAANVPKEFSSEVSFKDVSFSYGNDQILEHINVTIDSGECVALVGPSGSGKSTFANLILRFFDVTDGSVTVSGQDVRDWPKKGLRDKIALVSQMPILFTGTIRENILLGQPEASDAEVEAAARKAFAHDFILQLPNGYDTQVAEKGTSLSGGQRQRIALARAFLKDAPILILDEATSALDNESEAKVQEALERLVKDRTTLIIAHRLSTTKIADRVLAFDYGKMVKDQIRDD